MCVNLVGPTVGAPAPEIVLTGRASGARETGRATGGGPRVLAFVQRGSVDDPWPPDPEKLHAIRAQLRGLGAELIVLSPEGVWSMSADDPPEQVAPRSDKLAGDMAATARQYGVRDGDAVFVIDSDGVVRFAQHPAQPIGPVYDTLAAALAIAGDAMHARAAVGAAQQVLFTRREWTATCLVTGFATALFAGCKESPRTSPDRGTAPNAAIASNDIDVTLTINGKRHVLKLDPRTSLLDALRERLGLTGTKKGCDAGQCGACTVLIGGKRITSCLTLAVMAQNREITTIEGLAKGSVLHPMQQAFVDHDGLQCGYCTPGQILSAVALLDEGHARTDAEVREQMSGNICRCGAYSNIVAAIQAARRVRS
jgi:xanthine dehydrogenase YagT iron-sulfur-binding subunit